MTRETRFVHALAATLRRLEHEAATGQCAVCGEPAVGFISSWDNHPKGICAKHAVTAPLQGFTVHPDPEEDR